MAYAVKEIFFTLQGEGANSGRGAVFCRFAGCNLWTGRERDRATAICRFCDTEFRGTDGLGGNKFPTSERLTDAILARWPTDSPPFVVLTGGEPALQVDNELIETLHRRGASVAIETNGTLELPPDLDWVCVSPKAGAEVVVVQGDEVKLIYPQDGIDPDLLLTLDFHHFFLQPMDGPELIENTRACVERCLGDPRWRLSLQTHKLVGIP